MRRGFPLAYPGQRIGLLGGTFDPAHRGHRHIAETAQERLALDRVWWMATPQNPLKPKATPLAARVASARGQARGRKHLVTDFEARLGLTYSIDTVRALKRLYPGVHFVLVLGADNLATFRQWRNWRGIAAALPIAVVSRPMTGVRARFAPPFAQMPRLPSERAARLALTPAPVWTFLTARFSFHSSTLLRARARSGRA